MKPGFGEAAAEFRSASQTARVDTESWAAQNMFCPNCGNPRLSSFAANKPVADFFCTDCGDEFELKSQSRAFGRKVADGAFKTKMERLAADNSPNLILLQYDRVQRSVVNLHVIPRFLFTPSLIERRKPLGPNARRAGWVGSNIVLERIPFSGRVTVMQNGQARSRKSVTGDWTKLKFLESRVGDARGWLLDVMRCVEEVAMSEFTLSDVYAFEARLAELYPSNKNVRPKIRQQLQVLRDHGYLEFLSRGHYRRLNK